MKDDYQKKILIFGVGLSGRAAYRKLKQSKANRIIGFLDNNYVANNRIFFNEIVYSPSQITLIDFDLIAISGRDIVEIQSQLLEELKVPSHKILLLSRSDLSPSKDLKKKKEESILAILKDLIDFLDANNIQYWMDFSALLALHRKVDLSDFSDVDIALTSLADADKIFELMSNNNQNYKVEKSYIEEKLNYANIGDIKQICIQSFVKLEYEEPAIIDIHVKFLHESMYKFPVGKISLYTPVNFLSSYENIKYKSLSLKIPLNSKKYLELIYGKLWKKPAENWKAGDYGNLVNEK